MTISYSTVATAIPVVDMKEEVLRIEYYINGLPVALLLLVHLYFEKSALTARIMEKEAEGEDWEDIEEAVGEYGEEEGEYIPPGYQAAEGPFKSYCTCENFVTCSFCSWFYKIKNCKRHGQATRRPFTPCVCRDDEGKLPSLEELKQSLDSLKGPQARKVRSCVCTPKITKPVQCSCLNFLRDEPIKKEELAKDVEWQGLEELEEEDEEAIVEVFEEEYMEEEGEWEMMEDSGPEEKHDRISDSKRGTITKKEAENTCTCDIRPPPRSGSSTEVETDSIKSTSSSSLAELNVGEGFPEDEDAQVLTASEESSAESAAFDPTRIKWICYASDCSVDSITEDELDESEIDRIGAHWGIRNIYGRIPHATGKPKEKLLEKPSKDGRIHQYLVVQHNKTKVFKKTCKKKKDKPKPYFYRLMELENQ